jgi:hypothetical protein
MSAAAASGLLKELPYHPDVFFAMRKPCFMTFALTPERARHIFFELKKDTAEQEARQAL